MENDKRQHVRVPLPGAMATISCGNRVFGHCEICDVSVKGLLSNNIPSKLFKNNQSLRHTTFTAIVSYGSRIVKIKLEPRWAKADNGSAYAHVGFEVVENSQSWFDFIRTQTPLMMKRQEDVWGLNGVKYANR